MHTYSAYGLTVRSAFDLPELPTTGEETGEADVVFCRGEVEPVPESVSGKGGRRIQASPDRCRLSYESYGSFIVEDGQRARFDPRSEDVLEMKVIRRLLENEILGVLLHQRGRLMLHASAVSIDGRVAVFLGPRGVGKSTTAAAFYDSGHEIMEDDIVSVRSEGDTPVVDPGVPEMRLHADAVGALGIGDTTTYPNDGGSDKHYRQFTDVPAPAPIGAFYVLRSGDSLSVEDISEREQLFNLIESTYTQGMLSDTGQASTHFQQCANVVGTTPVRVLERPNDIDVLPELVDVVREDIRKPVSQISERQ